MYSEGGIVMIFQLLSDEMSNGLFELVKNIVLVIFGYQFNAGNKEKDSN